MKKLILLFVLMFAMLAGPVFACGNNVCTGDCHVKPDCPTQPDVWGVFFPTTDKDVASCGNVCGNAIGQYAWDGETVKALDLTTGEGFCKAPAKCLNWLLCNCDAADEIEVNGKYGITVEILTRGAKFESVASTGPPVITLAEYATQADLCAGDDAMTRDLKYHFTTEEQTVIVTNAYRRLFQRNSLFISLCDLPRIIVDDRIIPYGTPIVLRLGLYDGSIVCQPTCSRMCECTQVVAIAGCYDECCAVLSYLPMAEGWWAGIAITNLSAHDGSVAIAFVSDTEKKIKNFSVPAFGVKTILVNNEVDGETAFAVLKSSFSMRAVSFGGDAIGFYALPATTCGSCQ